MELQEHEFTESDISTSFNSTYRVEKDFNSMDYRLKGPVIEHKGEGKIIFDGIVKSVMDRFLWRTCP
jgi:allophanate hydrolase subunit 2